jgi:hypothetical protein
MKFGIGPLSRLQVYFYRDIFGSCGPEFGLLATELEE